MRQRGARRACPCRQRRRGSVMSLRRPVPLEDLPDDVVNLIGGQLRVHWEADAAGGIAFGVWYRADDPRLLAPRISFLLVNGDRVVRLGVDAILDEEVNELITVRGILCLDYIEMKDVPVAGSHERQIDVGSLSETGRV